MMITEGFSIDQLMIRTPAFIEYWRDSGGTMRQDIGCS
jgi:hypothetical protein